MDIITSVKVPDYVYDLFSKAAQEIGNVTTEEIMSRALFQYAELVAEDILRRDRSASPEL